MSALYFRPATPEDAAFLYQLLKASMQAYIDQTWGWDEDWQRDYFSAKYDPTRNRIVVFEHQDIGVLSVEERDDEVFLSNIQILPAYQGQGIGSQIVRDIQAEAFARGVPVALQVLKVNPARQLYERLGFVVVGETETHWQMRSQFRIA